MSVSPSRANRALPWLFVLLWSTGFIGARLGLPHADPLSFLLLRYVAVIVLMTLVALISRAPWPTAGRVWWHVGVTGLLVHGVYLSGVFIAISNGLPAAVAALVVGVQPLLTAVAVGSMLGEKVVRRQWIGLALGFLGVTLVLSGKVGGGFGIAALLPAILALLGITAGTLYQKRFCPAFDWRSGSVLQFLPTALLTGVVVWLTDRFHVEWVGEFYFALGWLVLVLSVGAISLLNWLIRHSDAVNVASLFYLVPPSTAVFAWILFGDVFSGLALLGMALAVWGVYLARK